MERGVENKHGQYAHYMAHASDPLNSMTHKQLKVYCTLIWDTEERYCWKAYGDSFDIYLWTGIWRRVYEGCLEQACKWNKTQVTSVSIDRCMQELDSGLPPAPTPFPGNLWPLWLVRTTAHTQKPTRGAGGGMRRNICEALLPVKAEQRMRVENKPKQKNKKRAWLVWVSSDGKAGDLRRSCNTQNRDNSGPKLESKESPGVCTWELSSDPGYAWLHFHRIHMTVSVAHDGRAVGYLLCDMAHFFGLLMDDVTILCS